MSVQGFRLDGAVALVTGASAGLGASMAVALARAGADVVAHGNTHSPAGTCTEIERSGRRAAPVAGDLADRAVSGRLDILINDAGLIRRMPAAMSPTRTGIM